MIDSKGGRGGVGGSLVPHPKHVMEMQSALSSGSSLGREVLVRDLAVSLCCVLGQVTLISQCLSLPRNITGYRRIVREA